MQRGAAVRQQSRRDVVHARARSRVSSSASTKLETTPSETVTPMACRMGTVDSASSANTSSVDSEQTISACSVRFCSAGSSAACSKNKRVVQAQARGQHQRDQVEQAQRNSAGAQHREDHERGQHHGREHAQHPRPFAQRRPDHHHQQHRGHLQAENDVRALRGDQLLGRGLEIEEGDVAARACAQFRPRPSDRARRTG